MSALPQVISGALAALTLVGLYELSHVHPKFGKIIGIAAALGWVGYALWQPNVGILVLNGALVFVYIDSLHRRPRIPHG